MLSCYDLFFQGWAPHEAAGSATGQLPTLQWLTIYDFDFRKYEEKWEADTSRGAEAFFAGAKIEPPYVDKEEIKQSREPPKVKERPKKKEENHIYENTTPINRVTVVAEIHRERSRPKSKRRPMKLPRKSRPPSAPLHPIYENEGSPNNSPSSNRNSGAAYENIGYTNTQWYRYISDVIGKSFITWNQKLWSHLALIKNKHQRIKTFLFKVCSHQANANVKTTSLQQEISVLLFRRKAKAKAKILNR